ncbi:MAG TPA: calcium-binding protein [Paracoccus sp. (in: a-proteobacteria)]|nr:calcium-binding protein [Paracoccus sp. (in: a-proteobacteria)]
MAITTWRDGALVSPLSGIASRITQLANGNILVTSATSVDSGPVTGFGTDIMGQMFDPYGNPVGPEFRVNTSFVVDNESGESIAPLTDGGFLAVYLDVEAGGTAVRYDRYNASGTFTGGGTVAAVTAGVSPFDLQAVTSSATSTMIAYRISEAGDTRVVARIFDATAGTLGPVVSLMNPPDNIGPMDAAVLPNGNYVIAAGTNAADDGIAIRIISPTGVNVLAYTVLAGTTTDGATVDDVSVTALANGNFVIAATETDANDTDVRIRVVSPAGTVLASPFVSGSGDIDNNTNEPSVTALSDGTFVVVYDDDKSDVLVAEHFSAAGVSLDTFQFNGPGTELDVTALADGRFAVSYYSNAAGGPVMEILDTRNGINAVPVYTPVSRQVGTVGDDVFTANAFANEVNAHAGNDTIHESGIIKTYLAGAGDDWVFVNSVINADVHDGGSGIDLIEWGTAGFLGGAFDLAAGTASSGGATEVMINFENLSATDGNDTIWGTAGVNRLWGGAGDDQMRGRGGADRMNGQAGNDSYYVDDVNDVVIEAAGGGDDRVYTSVSYRLSANVEQIFLVGVTAFQANGNALNNVVTGSQVANKLVGGVGNDTIWGWNGNDELHGEWGSDVLRGGNGADLLIGGMAADRFVFDDGDSDGGAFDRLLAGAGGMAFDGPGAAAGDVIDISLIDADSTLAGDQAFVFGGAGIGHLGIFNSGGHTLILGQTDADAAPEFKLVIHDGGVLASAYSAADFIL